MLTLQSPANIERFDIPHFKEGLLVSLAALGAVLLFVFAVDSGLARIDPVTPSAQAAGEVSAAPTVAPFDYFPSHYVNQAKDVEPPIDQF